jgi:hypothetical protein
MEIIGKEKQSFDGKDKDPEPHELAEEQAFDYDSYSVYGWFKSAEQGELSEEE